MLPSFVITDVALFITFAPLDDTPLTAVATSLFAVRTASVVICIPDLVVAFVSAPTALPSSSDAFASLARSSPELATVLPTAFAISSEELAIVLTPAATTSSADANAPSEIAVAANLPTVPAFDAAPKPPLSRPGAKFIPSSTAPPINLLPVTFVTVLPALFAALLILFEYTILAPPITPDATAIVPPTIPVAGAATNIATPAAPITAILAGNGNLLAASNTLPIPPATALPALANIPRGVFLVTPTVFDTSIDFSCLSSAEFMLACCLAKSSVITVLY